MKIVYTSDTDTLATIVRNGGHKLAEYTDSEGNRFYSVDVSEVCPTVFTSGQVLKYFSCERTGLTF